MKKNKLIILFLIVCFAVVVLLKASEVVLFAEEKVDEKKIEEKSSDKELLWKEYNYGAAEVEEESYMWLLVKTIIILGGIVAGFYYFFKFAAKKSGIRIAGNGAGRVLSVLPLGSNRTVQVVDLAGKVLVLGVSDNSINLITEIVSKEEIDKIRLITPQHELKDGRSFQDFVNVQISGFLKIVNGRIKNKNLRKEKTGKEYEPDLDYMKSQKKRLKGLNGFNDE